MPQLAPEEQNQPLVEADAQGQDEGQDQGQILFDMKYVQEDKQMRAFQSVY